MKRYIPDTDIVEYKLARNDKYHIQWIPKKVIERIRLYSGNPVVISMCHKCHKKSIYQMVITNNILTQLIDHQHGTIKSAIRCKLPTYIPT